MANYNLKSDLKKLVQKHLLGKTSEKEKAFLERYYHLFDNDKNVLESLSDEKVSEIENEIFANIQLATRKRKVNVKTVKLFPYKEIAAAVILMVTCYGVYSIVSEGKKETNTIALVNQKAPSGDENAVMLTLSDGTKVKLQDVQAGNVAKENGVSITKSADGTIIYTTNNNVNLDGTEIKYNTISTPNGQLSQVSLPDGTKVWLNAESSLKYPIAFVGKYRTVELRGEGYFEVAKNREIPFIVKTDDTEVKVLGTKFNISAYNNDGFTKTTLTEGLVSITKEKISKLLKPNQQALILKSEREIDISSIDVEEAMAWKNGYFMFNNQNIKTVMTMLSRWYNIEVEYQGDVEKEVLIGTVSRFDNVEKLLSTIELTGGVHFKVAKQSNGKHTKVVVTP